MRLLLLLVTTAAAVWAGLPARFELNRGQSPEQVKFQARGDGHSIFLTKGGATFHLAESGVPATITLNFDGASDAAIDGDNLLPGTANYFRGSDPEHWITNIPTYQRVRYKNLYPGIDVVFYTSEGNVEFDWVVAPDADPGRIQFSLTGGAAVLNANGDMELVTPAGRFVLRAPVLYQGGMSIGGRYMLLKDGKAKIAAGNYDPSKTLVVDPVIAYHARLGPRLGANVPTPGVSLLQGLNRGGAAVKVDPQGNAYVCGATTIADFPVTPGAVQPVYGGPPGAFFAQNDVFVSKVSPDGKTLLFSTYLGGASDDTCSSMAVDTSGNVFLVGNTTSINFPVTPGAFQAARQNNFSVSGFAAKLSANGNTLIYSTFLSSEGLLSADSIAVDSAGNAYVAGVTFSSAFPATPGGYVYSQPSGANVGSRAYALKLNAAGSSLIYGSVIGQANSSFGEAVPKSFTVSIAIDSAGNAYVGGTTQAVITTFSGIPPQTTTIPVFPVTDGAFQRTTGGGTDGFISKLSSDGSRLIYSTLLGGQGANGVDALVVDDQGQVVAVGHADSADFPVTKGSLWPAPNPEFPAIRLRYPSYGFAAKLNAAGSGLVFSTYIGGGGSIVLSGVTLDAQNNIFIVGSHDAPNFPVTPDSFQHCIGNNNNWSNAIVMKLAPSGDKLLFGSYLGGNVRDQGLALTVDKAGAVYVTGMTDSTDFLPTPGAVSDPLGTTFLTKIDMAPNTAPHLDCVVNATTLSGAGIAPLEIVSVAGAGIGPNSSAPTALTKDGLLDTTLLNTRVLFDGIPAPLISVSPTRIYAVAPVSIQFRTSTKVQVEQAGQLSNSITLPVATTAPGLFTTSNGGLGQAAVINEDGTVNSAGNPAPRNSVVSFFGQAAVSGNGQAIRPAGQVASTSQATGFAIMQISGIAVQPTYVGTVPGFSASLLQVNARIPVTTQTGPRIPVSISLGGGFLAQRTFIAVK